MLRGWLKRVRTDESGGSETRNRAVTDGAGRTADAARDESGGAPGEPAPPETVRSGGLAPDVDADGEVERLREERDFWRGLFEQVVDSFPEPVFVVDADHDVAYFNDAAADAYGKDPSAVVGRDAYEVFQTEGADEILAQTVERTGETVREEEFRKVPTDDGHLWNRSMGVPLCDPEGESVGAFEMTPIVTDIVEQRNQMSAAQDALSEDVSSAVERASDSAARVSDAVHEAARLAEEQAENMDEVSGEVGSLSATVEEIAASADEINDRAEEAEDLAESTRESGERAVETMEDVAADGRAVAEQTRSLREQIDEIDAIVEVINDIADQTNILALNANIEAARAGEAGEGFAVVANEVKSLATEVQQESERIEEILGETRADANQTVESIETVTERVREGAEAVEAMVQNQSEIAERVRDTSAGMDDIAAATDDQAVRTEEVASMVDDASNRSETVREEIHAAADANDEQVKVVASIDDAIAELESRMDELRE
jgi:PAS domain S-box-containing protein